MKTVVKRIRSIRIQKGYSQEYMSIQLGITKKTYRRLENGDTKIDLERLQKISEIFEIALQYFLEGTFENPSTDNNNEKTNQNTQSFYGQNEIKQFDERVKHLEADVSFLKHLAEKLLKQL